LNSFVFSHIGHDMYNARMVYRLDQETVFACRSTREALTTRSYPICWCFWNRWAFSKMYQAWKSVDGGTGNATTPRI